MPEIIYKGRILVPRDFTIGSLRNSFDRRIRDVIVKDTPDGRAWGRFSDVQSAKDYIDTLDAHERALARAEVLLQPFRNGRA